MRKDLSILTDQRKIDEKDLSKIDEMERKYKLKQEISAIAHKIERYTTRCESHRHNKQFKENQKRFYV